MNRTKGLVYFWVSVIILSAANSVLAKLGIEGAKHLINGRNPISFCNVLFTSNLIAGITIFMVRWKAWNRQNFVSISTMKWLQMFFISLLSIVAPILVFGALMLTEVINVVLISSFDIPLALVFGWLISRERPTILSTIAALIALSGILVIFLLHQPEISKTMKITKINLGANPIARFIASFPKAGEIFVLIGVVFNTMSDEFSRKYLITIPPGIYSVFRMFTGSLVFFFVVIIMLGWIHFIDIFSPFLWEWMFVYGGVIIAFGFYCWFVSLPMIKSVDFSIGNAFAPVAGIFFAYLIVGEIPDRGQIIGGSLILAGIAINLAAQLAHLAPLKKITGLTKIRNFIGV